MSRLIIISNRLPVTIDKKEGELHYHPSAGGLATGLNSLDSDIDKVWIGWPGKAIKEESERERVRQDLTADGLVPVFLSKKDIELYYEGFSNKVIWPHFHYFTQYTTYNEEYWRAYVKVNEKFARVVCELLQPDDLVWVHDYQLMLLPALIRERFPNISIGFFLHIPFPSYEIFRILPWREQILFGLLGADQIGFHTFGYMRHFLSAAYRIAGYEHNFGKLTVGKRLINVDVFPMGIDYDKYAFAENYTSDQNNYMPDFKKDGQKIILSIDRLDYTKGIPQRILAFERFIKEHPAHRGKVSLVMLVVPSRSNVDQYKELKGEIDTLVGRIDSTYGSFDWQPIKYFYRSLPFKQLTDLYRAADVALITPLRDGMNLVAKEYVAAKERDKRGVLILSEMAGASNEMTEAISVNPHDAGDVAQAIVQALDMPVSEQAERLAKMQEKLQKYNVQRWAETFLHAQMEMREFQRKRQTSQLNDEEKQRMCQRYAEARSRLIFLDYDGTLMDFHPDPKAVVPDKPLLQLLERLKADPRNHVVIISGRDRYTLNEWLGQLQLDMAAEHGVWVKRGEQWQSPQGIASHWKQDVRPVLENLVERTPGTFIEEKDYSIAWHYRKIDKDLGEKRVREFRDVLLYLTANLDLQVLEGNKVVEIKNAGINKGKAALLWVNQQPWDFVMAIGDDHTDEDTFKACPMDAYTIKVGLAQSVARFNLLSVEEVRGLLADLVEAAG